MALRGGRFSGPAYDTLVEGTIRGAISYVAQTFRDNDRPNPTKDEDGELGRLLSRLYRSFKNEDPNPVQQKALPICVLRELAKIHSSETQKATLQLAIGAYFFAMRSCEYLKVPQAEKRRTDILRMRCIRFFRGGKLMKHNNPWLEYADCVSITFEWQKKDTRMDTVTQMASRDLTLCGVRIWAAVVRNILGYPGANEDTPSSLETRKTGQHHITGNENSSQSSSDLNRRRDLGNKSGRDWYALD